MLNLFGIIGFILGSIGVLYYCGRTRTFFFIPGMKYYPMVKLEVILVIVGFFLFALDVFMPLFEF